MSSYYLNGNLILIIPTILAFFSVFGVELAFVTGTLGAQYNASVVWDAWGPIAPNFTTCEVEDPTKFIRRPLTSLCGVFFIAVGLIIICRSMMDIALSPIHRNACVLMEREVFWGFLLGIWPIAIGAITFFAFASTRELLLKLINWFWWATLSQSFRESIKGQRHLRTKKHSRRFLESQPKKTLPRKL